MKRPYVRRIVLIVVLFGAVVLSDVFFPVIRPSSVKISDKPIEVSTSAASIVSQDGKSVWVVRVVDGDTIEIEGGQIVRYIGIDAPETVHPQKATGCFGREASDKNKQLVGGKIVRLEKDVSEKDRYDRLLRYVYIDGVMVNDILVREGFAHVSTFPPDVKYTKQLQLAEREARAYNRGLWGGCPLL